MDAEAINEELVEALKESLTRLVGEKGTKAVLYFIENDFAIRLGELSSRVTDLHSGFVRVFGVRLSVLVENAIAKDFCDRLSQKYNKNLTLFETVEKARRKCLNQSRKAKKADA